MLNVFYFFFKFFFNKLLKLFFFLLTWKKVLKHRKLKEAKNINEKKNFFINFYNYRFYFLIKFFFLEYFKKPYIKELAPYFVFLTDYIIFFFCYFFLYILIIFKVWFHYSFCFTYFNFCFEISCNKTNFVFFTDLSSILQHNSNALSLITREPKFGIFLNYQVFCNNEQSFKVLWFNNNQIFGYKTCDYITNLFVYLLFCF